MFSQEPCFGVNTNSNLHSGIVDRKAFVSFDVCAEWLSSMIRTVYKQIEMQFDENGNIIVPDDYNLTITVSGIVDRKAFVSFDVCAEWLSSMIRMVSCAGYFKSSIFRKRTKSALLWVSTLAKLHKHIQDYAAEAGFPRLTTISKTRIQQILKEQEIKPFKIKYYCEKRVQNQRFYGYRLPAELLLL